MEQDLNDLKAKLIRIKNMGYIKAVNNDSSGIGLTLEKELGKSIDNFPLPDFKNLIEIKTKLAFSKRPIHLFSLIPEGKDFFESNRILDTYGYFSKNNEKRFNGTIVANKKTKIGKNYYFSLEVNYKEEKITLLVYNNLNMIIDNSTYWDFNKLDNAISRKIKYLAFVQVWSTERNKIKYYKYFKYDFFKFSNIYTFLNLVEKGIISITFSMNTYKNNKNDDRIHNHGTTFDISKEDLYKLFFHID